MSVLDSSALLAYVQGERGADQVEAALEAGSCCSAVNWSETARKVLSSHRDWGLCSSLLYSFDITIEPVTVEDAEWAARRWRRGENLSIADRLCLALSARLSMPALTADKAWADYPNTMLIR